MKTLISLIIFLALLVFLAPFVINTPMGKEQLERYISWGCDCKLTVGKLRLSWFDKQTAEDIAIDKQDIHLTIKKITVNSRLFPLLLKARHPKEILFFGNLQLQDGTVSRLNSNSIGHFSVKTSPNDKVVIHVEKFPTAILKSSSPLREAIGETFNSDATITFTNKEYEDFRFNASFTSPNLSFIADGNCNNRTITLNSPLKANFLLTEELGNKIFTQSPIRPTSIKPMQITIFPNGVAIPLDNPSLEKMSIPNMTLNLHQMLIKNYRTVATLLSIVEFNLRPNQDVNFWFQEANIQLKNGVLTYPRTEMLVDNKYQLGTWGNINLVTKTLDTYVGITASVLKSAFNITIVPDTYVIPVKIDGTLTEPKVHKLEATTIISGLLLLQTQSNLLPFKQLPATSPAPPARPPFPWQ